MPSGSPWAELAPLMGRLTPTLARLCLRGLALGFVWPLLINLLFGRVDAVLGCGVGMALLWVAGRLVADGLVQEAAVAASSVAVPVRPLKRLGIGAIAAAAGALALGAAHGSFIVALIMAGLAAWGAWSVIGDDPLIDRREAEERARQAGFRPADVAATLERARAKIGAIELASAGLANRELRQRLTRIVALAQTILQRLEAEPRLLDRAQRFLVTYLDGTRDVVRSYAAQESDLAAGPLARNFRRVLGTIEQVFEEQLGRMRDDRQLDLGVQIEVLERQLVSEGVR